MTANFTPSLLMALTDYIPVILFLIGSFYLGSIVHRKASTFVFIMFVIGISISHFAGFAKATWKLLLATSGTNIAWLDDFQFLFLGIGIFLVFVSILTIVIKQTKKSKRTLAPALLTIKGTSAFYYLLTLVVLSTIGYLSCLIILSRKVKCHISVIFYIIYGVISILMGALSGSGEYEIVNWIAQSINTIGTLSLLIAHINLNKKDLENFKTNAIAKAA